jgi:hypothetical protein
MSFPLPTKSLPRPQYYGVAGRFGKRPQTTKPWFPTGSGRHDEPARRAKARIEGRRGVGSMLFDTSLVSFFVPFHGATKRPPPALEIFGITH